MDKYQPPTSWGILFIAILLCLMAISYTASVNRGNFPKPVDAEKHPPTEKTPEHKGGGGGMF